MQPLFGAGRVRRRLPGFLRKLGSQAAFSTRCEKGRAKFNSRRKRTQRPIERGRATRTTLTRGATTAQEHPRTACAQQQTLTQSACPAGINVLPFGCPESCLALRRPLRVRPGIAQQHARDRRQCGKPCPEQLDFENNRRSSQVAPSYNSALFAEGSIKSARCARTVGTCCCLRPLN